MIKTRMTVLLLLVTLLAAQAQKTIAVEDFTTRPTFAAKSVNGINWMKDGKYYASLEGNKVVKYQIATGQSVETIIDGASTSPRVDIQDYTLSDDEQKLLVATNMQSIYRRSFTAEYYVYDRTTKVLRPLSPNGPQAYAAFSPDGTKVAFVRTNDLYYVDLASGHEVRVTDDGKLNHIMNGAPHWIYEEEFGLMAGFCWSPDSKKLAYYRFDESGVKEYNMQVWGKQLYPADLKSRYPKAGEANATVSVHLYHLDTGAKATADLGIETDIYVPRIMWTRDAATLSVRKMNRLQNELQLLHINAYTGASTVVLQQRSDTYIDIKFIDDMVYLADGRRFISSNESDGYKHLYLYSVQGTLLQQITMGNFEASQLIGYDEKTRTVYYTSTEVAPQERHLYAIGLDGRHKVKLSAAAGTHTINMSRDFQFYIDHHSSATQPTVVSLYKTKGNSLVKVLETNETLQRAVAEYGLAKKEFFSFRGADGTPLEGYMLKPRDFDPHRRYPVMVYQYSGPGSQLVSNSWGGSHYYFHQLLTQKGYLVVVADTRGTGARGEKFRKVTYKQLGKYELEDHLAVVRYLATLDYVDAGRLGTWGWSYGGYMATLAMTKGNGMLRLGIAVAPITNWRFLNTIYTERYMQTPQLNPGGYDDNAPLTYATNLTGHFLLIHGTGDDDVHLQHALVLQEALVNAGKQFRSFYYTDKHHGLEGGKTRLHLYTMMLDFIVEKL